MNDYIKRADALIVPVPAHGKWIARGENDIMDWLECSECGAAQSRQSNYCPNCGARMYLPMEENDE